MNEQRQVVAWVKELGGGVRYDYECDDRGLEIADLEIPVPKPPCDPEMAGGLKTQIRWLLDLPPRILYLIGYSFNVIFSDLDVEECLMRFAAKMLVVSCVLLVASSWVVAAEPADIPELALKAMEFRVGSWESTGFIDGVKQTKLGKETTKWTPGRYAICCVGQFDEEGKEVHATGVIGWDAERKQLVEEWYSSDGGKATFCYTLDAEKQAGIGTFKWVYADGRIYKGESFILVKTNDEWVWEASYKVDGKTHTWRTVNRRVK